MLAGESNEAEGVVTSTEEAHSDDDTAAQQPPEKTLLDCLHLSVSFGKGLERKPFIAVGGNRMRREARDAMNTEIEGRFRQNTKILTTVKFAVLYVPYIKEGDIKAEVQHVADRVRTKTVRAANAFLLSGLQLPKRVAGLPFFHLFDQDDREFEAAPGWIANPNRSEDWRC